MNNKRVRYITSIFTLDRIVNSVGMTIWDNGDITKFIEEQEKHYGLKLISHKEELLIEVEYTNMIWRYRIYYGSYKKRYKTLNEYDERWEQIEEKVLNDLKVFGMEELKDKVLLILKNKEYLEYKTKIEKQFKQYCV